MTLETCKKRYEIAKEANNTEEMEFWLNRIKTKSARHVKYKDIDVDEFLGLKEVKTDGKKSKG